MSEWKKSTHGTSDYECISKDREWTALIWLSRKKNGAENGVIWMINGNKKVDIRCAKCYSESANGNKMEFFADRCHKKREGVSYESISTFCVTRNK